MSNTIESLVAKSIFEFASDLAIKTGARAVLVYRDAAGDIETMQKMVSATPEIKYIFTLLSGCLLIDLL